MSTTKVQLIAPKYQDPSKKGVSVRLDSTDTDQKLAGSQTSASPKDRDAIIDIVARKTAERRRTNQELKKMLPEDRIKATADQRVLMRHSKQQSEWDRMDKGIAAAVGRDESDLVHNRLASHREHVEEQHLLRQAVPPQERVGEEYWSLSLRNPTMPDRPFAPRAAAAAAAMAQVQRKLGPSITHVPVGGPVGGLWAKVKEEANEALESVRVPRKSKKSPQLPPLGTDQMLVKDLGIPVTSGDVRSPSSLSSYTTSGCGSPTPDPTGRGTDSRLSGSTAISNGRGARRRTEREGSFTKTRKNQLQKRLKNIMHHDPTALNDLCITGTDLFSEPAPPPDLLGNLPHVEEHSEDQEFHALSELKYAEDDAIESNTQPTIKGPAIEVSHTRIKLQSDTPLRLSSDSVPQWPPLKPAECKNAYATLTIKNTGSTAVHYWWELAEPLFPEGGASSEPTRNPNLDGPLQIQITAPQSPRAVQRMASLMSPRGSIRAGRSFASELTPFQSSCARGVILPGDSIDSVWSFVPVAPGVYLKRLRLVTVPALPQAPTLVLEGVSRPIDEGEAAREQLFKQLVEDAEARREKRDSESVWNKSSIAECALDHAISSQPDLNSPDPSAPSSAEQLSHQMHRARAVAFQKINADMCPKLYYQPEVFHAFEHLCALIVSHHRRSLRREFQWNGSIASLYELLNTLPPRSRDDASVFRNQLDELCRMASNRPEPSAAGCQFFGALLGDIALRMDRWRMDSAETTGVVADSLIEAELIPKVRTLSDELAHLQAAAAAQPPAAPEQPKETPVEDSKNLSAPAPAAASKRASQTVENKVVENPLVTTELQLKAAGQELMAVQERLQKKRQEMAAAMYLKVKQALLDAVGELAVNYDPQQAPSENGPALQQKTESIMGRWEHTPLSLCWVTGECPAPAQPAVLSSQPTLPLESISQVASTQSIIYALSADGEVFVAKSPAQGQSGAKPAPRLSWRLLEFAPPTRSSQGTIQKLAVGPQRVLAITSAQSVITWTHSSGNSAVQWQTLSLRTESEQDAKALAVACSSESDFGLILSASGKVFVVGSAAGVLTGEPAGPVDAPLEPKIVPGFDDKPVSLIAAGAQHALAVTTVGKNSQLWAWGDNAACQLGTGDKKPKNIPTFVPLAPISGKEKDKEKDALSQPEIVSIACGPRHSFAVTPTQIFSFGTGAGASLGHADLVNKDGSSKEQKLPRALTVPTPPSGPLSFTNCSLIAGARASAVIGKFGALLWGSVPFRSLPAPASSAPAEAKGKPAPAAAPQPTAFSENVPKLFAADPAAAAIVNTSGAEAECGLLVCRPRAGLILWTPPPPVIAAEPAPTV